MFSIEQATFVLFGWAMLWAALLPMSLSLMTDRYQAKISWGTSSGVAFLFAVMFMHHLLPAYSRSQSLFGESSPLREQLAADDQSNIATVDHEFSEVPFYLDRDDIPNYSDIHNRGLHQFVYDAGSSILIVDNRINPRDLLSQLPRSARLNEVARRGSARIFEATVLTGSSRTASKPKQVAEGARR